MVPSCGCALSSHVIHQGPRMRHMLGCAHDTEQTYLTSTCSLHSVGIENAHGLCTAPRCSPSSYRTHHNYYAINRQQSVHKGPRAPPPPVTFQKKRPQSPTSTVRHAHSNVHINTKCGSSSPLNTAQYILHDQRHAQSNIHQHTHTAPRYTDYTYPSAQSTAPAAAEFTPHNLSLHCH